MSDLPASRRIIFSAVACVLTIGLVEGILWLAGLPTWFRLQLQTAEISTPLRAASETLRQHVASPGRARAVEGRSYWLYTQVQIPGLSVNSLGFRGSEPSAREPGEVRVAMLGGSSVYGWLVPDDMTVPALLERELSHRLRLPVTVFNLGVEGLRFQQEVELAEDLLPLLDVDVVVTLHGVNDAVHDLSGLFDAEPETRFQDFVHLLPKGNALVARSITDIFQRDPASWCVAMNPGS